MPDDNSESQNTSNQASAVRRRPLPANATIADLRAALADVDEPETGPNVNTEPEDPAGHYFLATDGKTQINAFGEKKGSDEDRRRMVALGFAQPS
jgi:hypothetical protein